MKVYVHGFDWKVYAEYVMPTFARWLIDADDSAVSQLYQHTRCAQGERFVPSTIQHLCSWPRAQAFARQLPRGPHALHEYQKLCMPEQFTAFSDHYMHQHPPQLYQNAEAIRIVWGAIVEQYCLPWIHLPQLQDQEEPLDTPLSDQTTILSELVSLLHTAGLNDLAQKVSEQATMSGQRDEQDLPADEEILSNEEDTDIATKGILLGYHPTMLHLRGWLATISVRAMALFEFLVCGRRRMPFGYQTDDPFGAYIGYLTPDEVCQLASCLRDIQPPDQTMAEEDFQRFCSEQREKSAPFRLIDEVLPANAHALLQVVRRAALQKLGLICSTD